MTKSYQYVRFLMIDIFLLLYGSKKQEISLKSRLIKNIANSNLIFLRIRVKYMSDVKFCVESCSPLIYIQYVYTGSPKKHETLRTTWGLLTEISERMKSHSINPNMEKITMMLLEFYRGLVYLQDRIFEVKKSACLMFSGTPCICIYCKIINKH